MRPEPAAEAGFTLLEVIVALVIASLALGLLVRGVEGLGAVRLSQRYDEAVSRARSHLASVGHGVPVRTGRQEGEDGGGFRWSLDIRPAAGALLGGAAADAVHPMRETLFRVEATETWDAPGGARRVSLTTQRAASDPEGGS